MIVGIAGPLWAITMGKLGMQWECWVFCVVIVGILGIMLEHGWHIGCNVKIVGILGILLNYCRPIGHTLDIMGMLWGHSQHIKPTMGSLWVYWAYCGMT